MVLGDGAGRTMFSACVRMTGYLCPVEDWRVERTVVVNYRAPLIHQHSFEQLNELAAHSLRHGSTASTTYCLGGQAHVHRNLARLGFSDTVGGRHQRTFYSWL
jgi:hypothetical protein